MADATTAILGASGQQARFGGHPTETLQRLAAALKRAPRDWSLWTALGVCHWRQAQWERSARAFQHAVSMGGEAWPALVGLGCVRLTQGRFGDGWRAYRGRWQMAGWVEAPAFPMASCWDGVPRRGESVLLWCGADLGEAIQYVRLLPWLAARGMRVRLLAPPALEPLFAAQWPELMRRPQDRYFDSHCPLADVLSLWQGDPVGTLAQAGGYLDLGGRHPGRGAALRVGLAFGRGDASIGAAPPARCWEPLKTIDAVAWVSLAIGGREGMGAADIARLAKAVAGLDLVITSDALVAHLAGAAGCATWLVLGPVPQPTWLLDRTDSPWYPSMRIFRCGAQRSAAAIAADMASALLRHADAARASLRKR